jgi:hypothetical protein
MYTYYSHDILFIGGNNMNKTQFSTKAGKVLGQAVASKLYDAVSNGGNLIVTAHKPKGKVSVTVVIDGKAHTDRFRMR